MEKMKSEVRHPENSKAKNTYPCFAGIKDSATIELSFSVKRQFEEDLVLELHNDDLRDILLEYAQKVPGASTLFAECVSKAVEADNKLLKEVAASTEFSGQIYGDSSRPWLDKLSKYRVS